MANLTTEWAIFFEYHYGLDILETEYNEGGLATLYDTREIAEAKLKSYEESMPDCVDGMEVREVELDFTDDRDGIIHDVLSKRQYSFVNQI